MEENSSLKEKVVSAPRSPGFIIAGGHVNLVDAKYSCG
jgi:hypothetical protein